MFTLAADLVTAFGRWGETQLTAIPATDDSVATTASTAAGASSAFTDPVVIALICAAGLFFLSWRMSMRKGPD